MNKIAVDTNIFLYSLDQFYPDKQERALDLIADRPTICTQNLSEFANVCLRRWKYFKSRVASLIDVFAEECNYVVLDKYTILRASKIMHKYDFQYFDALIISAALNSGCEIFYSEDMHHQLLVENQLRIINPF